MAVELDGNFHTIKENKEYDIARTNLLNKYGIRLIRFWNNEVLQDVERVIERIGDYLD